MGLQKEDECQDPEHQKARGVNTYYPLGTVCYTDPSQGISPIHFMNVASWKNKQFSSIKDHVLILVHLDLEWSENGENMMKDQV